DTFFTATSAVCVTGLTVVDISKVFNFWGQLIILLWIQIGGLGYMMFATMVIIFFGRLDVVQKNIVGESLNITEFVRITQVVPLMKTVLKLTLGFEFLGVIILFLKFMLGEKLDILHSLWNAIFHSISAFCNAGFSLFSNSLENYQSDLVINIVIPLLIICGGLGFFVWMDIFRNLSNKRWNFMLHTKIVFLVTISLILITSLLFFMLNRSIFIMKGLSLKAQLLISWFQSVTPRTAGFNTFPINQLSDLTVLIIICLMFIGASPGGTAGGIKTTTFFVVLYSVFSYIRGERYVTVFKRRIGNSIILKSFTIFFVCFIWVIVISFIIYLFNKFSYREILFETVSAFGTVGLSLGITPYIDNFSKILLIITMIFGRVGGLTLLSVLLTEEPKEIKYLEEPISVG
ncbi:MAG: TrkH family potassium uptake protein, partial [Endomicrobia bacterium]|nr:TrkH family potassium uptake protein [Endomicrobiia bacterium]